ncbi:MAG: outer membrane protein assembly factor BamE [Alphaproteobacteria bacterium]|nr:outer membrane protein assembly factor BamE [Alphaproteobacteria bacterium]
MKLTPIKKTVLLAGAALLAAQVAACTPRVATRGNLLSQSQIASLEPESALRADVQRVWGPPSAVSPFDDKTWYYIGEVTSQKGIFAPEVEQRQVVKVTFNEEEAVTEIAMLDPAQAQKIDYVARRTPTAGREFTAFQQFVGNLGRFNQNIQSKPGANIPK